MSIDAAQTMETCWPIGLREVPWSHQLLESQLDELLPWFVKRNKAIQEEIDVLCNGRTISAST
jgi:hypothetical protein